MCQYSWASLVAQLVKNLPAMQETWCRAWAQLTCFCCPRRSSGAKKQQAHESSRPLSIERPGAPWRRTRGSLRSSSCLGRTHIHRVSDAIQPSHLLSSPSPPALNPSQHQSLFPCKNPSCLELSFLTREPRPIPALWTDSTRGAIRSLPPHCRPSASGLRGSDRPAPRHLECDVSPETCSCPTGGHRPRAQSAGQPGPAHLGGLPSASARAAGRLPPCRPPVLGPGPWRLGDGLCGLLVPCAPALSML